MLIYRGNRMDADKTQDYKVTLIFKNKGGNHPTDWLHNAVEQPCFADEIETFYTSEVQAIDRLSDKWKWLNDIDHLNKHIDKNQTKESIEQVEALQNNTHSPSNWAEYEEELSYLRERMEKLESWHNQVSNSKET